MMLEIIVIESALPAAYFRVQKVSCMNDKSISP